MIEIIIALLILLGIFLFLKNDQPMEFSNKYVNKTANQLKKAYGNPDRVEMNTKNKSITKMTWFNVDGCDGIVVKGDIK